jgi:hypothetical protein
MLERSFILIDKQAVGLVEGKRVNGAKEQDLIPALQWNRDSNAKQQSRRGAERRNEGKRMRINCEW